MTTYKITEKDMGRTNNIYIYHAPKDTQTERYETIREMGKTMALLLQTTCPPSRELSLALTHLEETVMWANASIARNE